MEEDGLGPRLGADQGVYLGEEVVLRRLLKGLKS